MAKGEEKDPNARRPINVHITDDTRSLVKEAQKHGLSQAEIVERGLFLLDERYLTSADRSNDFRKGGKKQKVFNITNRAWDKIDEIAERKDIHFSKTAVVEMAIARYVESKGVSSSEERNLFLKQFSDQDLVDELQRRRVEL